MTEKDDPRIASLVDAIREQNWKNGGVHKVDRDEAIELVTGCIQDAVTEASMADCEGCEEKETRQMTVEHRRKTELPTKPGIYYARFAAREGDQIVPVKVIKSNYDGGKSLAVMRLGWDLEQYIADYAFFGPVPEVREG